MPGDTMWGGRNSTSTRQVNKPKPEPDSCWGQLKFLSDKATAVRQQEQEQEQEQDAATGQPDPGIALKKLSKPPL